MLGRLAPAIDAVVAMLVVAAVAVVVVAPVASPVDTAAAFMFSADSSPSGRGGLHI